MKKKGNILTENVIFIVLNLVFITILLLFLFSKAGAGPVMEEKYAKQIALLIDGAEPVMEITLDMEKAVEKAIDNSYPLGEIVKIDGNLVTVKLSADSQGYSYSFFNDVSASANFDTEGKKGYYFVITENEN